MLIKPTCLQCSWIQTCSRAQFLPLKLIRMKSCHCKVTLVDLGHENQAHVSKTDQVWAFTALTKGSVGVQPATLEASHT